MIEHMRTSTCTTLTSACMLKAPEVCSRTTPARRALAAETARISDIYVRDPMQPEAGAPGPGRGCEARASVEAARVKVQLGLGRKRRCPRVERAPPVARSQISRRSPKSLHFQLRSIDQIMYHSTSTSVSHIARRGPGGDFSRIKISSTPRRPEASICALIFRRWARREAQPGAFPATRLWPRRSSSN